MKTKVPMLLLLVATNSPPTAHAQVGGRYDLSWSTVAGGGTSAAGVYSVSATAGQPDAGSLNSGIYTMDIGFWSIAAIHDSFSPLLTITRAGTDLLISFPSLSTGFVLEQNSSLVTFNWTAVTNAVSDNGNTRSVIIQPSRGSKFYRLRK